MTKQISETAADVAALIPRYSWELMDEEQRDALMGQVVLSRYMQTTSDGVKMTPTWWGELVGASPAAVKSRVERLKAKASSDDGSGAATSNQIAARAHAKRVLRESSPEQIKEVLADLPTGQIDKVASAATDVLVSHARAKRAERSIEPTAGELMGGEEWDPSESWADTLIIRTNGNAHLLHKHVERWGLVLGSLSEDEAFERLQETERFIAEVRVILQERVREVVA